MGFYMLLPFNNYRTVPKYSEFLISYKKPYIQIRSYKGRGHGVSPDMVGVPRVYLFCVTRGVPQMSDIPPSTPTMIVTSTGGPHVK